MALPCLLVLVDTYPLLALSQAAQERCIQKSVIGQIPSRSSGLVDVDPVVVMLMFVLYIFY